MIYSRERIKFNVDNKDHVEMYRNFLQSGGWAHSKGCPFDLEFPYLTIPDMIKDKLVRKFLKV